MNPVKFLSVNFTKYVFFVLIDQKEKRHIEVPASSSVFDLLKKELSTAGEPQYFYSRLVECVYFRIQEIRQQSEYLDENEKNELPKFLQILSFSIEHTSSYTVKFD